MHRSIRERVPYGEKTTRRAVKGLRSLLSSSSETQGQIVGARESLNRRENMAQKKSKERPEELFWPFFTFLLCHIFPPV